MRLKIKEIAEIQIGYQFRRKIESNPNGTHQVIQIRDFDENRNLRSEGISKVTLEQPVERYLVKKGDVLFLARGHRNFAISIKETLEETIAASYFFIIKLKNKNIHPDYLSWFIDQVPAQEYLHNLARRGSHMPVVPKTVFENMKIDVPDLDTQKKIVELNRLLEKEWGLLQGLQEKSSLLVRSISLQAARKK